MVVQADKSLKDRPLQLHCAVLHSERTSRLLHLQTEQVGEWRYHIFFEWPNGFSCISW